MPKPKIEIYTRDFCGFCTNAKALFQQDGLEFTEYNIWQDHDHQLALEKRLPNYRTVPQIFINGYHVGGCDELFKAKQNGDLARLLST